MTNQIEKYDFKDGLTYEFELLDLSDLVAKSFNELISPHRTEFYQVFWFQKGNHEHIVDFKTIKISPDTLLFVNKNSVQQFDGKAKFTGKALLFTENFFCQTLQDTKFLKSTILFNDLLSVSTFKLLGKYNEITMLFEQLATEFSKPKDAFQRGILLNLLKNLLLFSERERRRQDFVPLKNDENLEYAIRFKDLLEHHFVQHKTVAFYVGKLHISAKKLNVVTQKIFGKPPKNIILERVILEAKRLLSHTTHSVKEIAYLLGFEESTNFIKFFKKHTKTTPVDFRDTFI